MTYRMPAEWAQHERVWIGFPWDEREWPRGLKAAQEQIAAFANAVHDSGNGETVYLVTGSAEAAERARSVVEDGIFVEHRPIGDSWLRDTGCIIVSNGANRLARNFRFNGWGGRYLMAGDQTIGRELANAASLDITECNWILEGGAIDVDGEGLAVTTAECLLNPNRNPALGTTEIEAYLLRDLGIERLLWLGNGLAGDHTDGHVDNLARFVAPSHLVIPQAQDSDDPNTAVYADARARAEAFGCKVTALPSVGRYEQDGIIVPASYLNFYISNSAVILPLYGSKHDDEALTVLEALMPSRRIIELPADAILTGGGSFHCLSQQVPL